MSLLSYKNNGLSSNKTWMNLQEILLSENKASPRKLQSM